MLEHDLRYPPLRFGIYPFQLKQVDVVAIAVLQDVDIPILVSRTVEMAGVEPLDVHWQPQRDYRMFAVAIVNYVVSTWPPIGPFSEIHSLCSWI